MASAEVASRKPTMTADYTIGRGGIKIPKPEAVLLESSHGELWTDESVLDFFRQLRSLNELREDDNGLAELAIPANRRDPFTVIRSRSLSRSRIVHIEDRPFELGSSQEIHSILVGPRRGQAAQFNERFRVSYETRTEDRGYIDVDSPNPARVQTRHDHWPEFDGESLTRQSISRALEGPRYYDMPRDEQQQLLNRTWDTALKQMIDASVELLSV